jgi:hypothetical protein
VISEPPWSLLLMPNCQSSCIFLCTSKSLSPSYPGRPAALFFLKNPLAVVALWHRRHPPCLSPVGSRACHPPMMVFVDSNSCMSSENDYISRKVIPPLAPSSEHVALPPVGCRCIFRPPRFSLSCPNLALAVAAGRVALVEADEE